MMEYVMRIIEDGTFAAVASVGFASISDTPRRAMGTCAVLAAVGHALRYVLMGVAGLHIITASTVAAFCIGTLAVLGARRIKCPAEVCFFPALLPMIPGMYAYRAVEGLMQCLYCRDAGLYSACLNSLCYNGLTCMFIVVGMVVGATVPVFALRHIAFQATRKPGI